MLHQQVSLIQGSAVDAEARVYLRAKPGADVQAISGQIYGPNCEFARTLASTFPACQLPAEREADCLAEVILTDPCFWTPRLPFLYDLNLELTTPAGESLSYETTIAVKRWSADGANWKLDGKRIVLRGAELQDELDEDLSTAREAETALLVPPTGDMTLDTASYLGVPHVVDLRDAGERLDDELDRLAWTPAVLAVILDTVQLANRSKSRPVGLPVGLALNTKSSVEETQQGNYDFYAVELNPEERPPRWLANSDKPVIAIRRGEVYADFRAARSACDCLQAELAPEFDLAGYFAAP